MKWADVTLKFYKSSDAWTHTGPFILKPMCIFWGMHHLDAQINCNSPGK